MIGASTMWLAFFQVETLAWSLLLAEIITLHCGRRVGSTRGPEPDPNGHEQLRSYIDLFGVT